MKQIALCTLLFAGMAFALQANPGDSPIERPPQKESNYSLRNEVQLSIDRGLAWLKEQQQPDGHWSTSDHPALTALSLTAFLDAPSKKYRGASKPEFIEKGFAFIRSNAKPDGSIYTTLLSNYNTSVCLMALLNNGDPKDAALEAAAHDFIAGLQAKNMTDESLDGGVGYGPTAVSKKRQHPDLDNMVVALEALRAYQVANPTGETTAKPQLDWNAAIGFINRCQNLPESNPKASTSVENRGGFVYYPGFSNAAPADGSDPLRSYGTMSYAGLLSFIYADVKKDDPRVTAALAWLQKNYTLDKNPGMGEAGYYYYLHLMAKGLTAAKVTEIEANGKKIDWARESALKFMNLQATDGSWVNTNGRFMEKDPVLVTCYSVRALELIYQNL